MHLVLSTPERRLAPGIIPELAESGKAACILRKTPREDQGGSSPGLVVGMSNMRSKVPLRRLQYGFVPNEDHPTGSRPGSKADKLQMKICLRTPAVWRSHIKNAGVINSGRYKQQATSNEIMHIFFRTHLTTTSKEDKMDQAEQWLRKNDPKYKLIAAKNLRKRKEKEDYLKSLRTSPHRGKQHARKINGKMI